MLIGDTTPMVCSAGQPANISVKGLTLDGMLDDAGNFHILQLLPSPDSKPGAAPASVMVSRDLLWFTSRQRGG
jgi:hypothetical protein